MTEKHIGKFLDFLSFQRKYSLNTVQAYASDLKEFTAFINEVFDENDLTKVSGPQIRNWVASLMESGRSPRSVNRKISTLKSFYSFLKKENEIKSVPTNVVKTIKAGTKLPAYVEQDEINRLMDQLDFRTDYPSVLNSMVISLLYHTGIRRAELIGLKVRDVSLSGGTIKVLGKRNKERIIPIGDELVEHLNLFLVSRNSEGLESDLLLVLPNGKPLYPKFVYNTITSALGNFTRATRRSPHVLRHSFATHMLRNGADLNAIKELLGHSNLAATQIYTHNSIDHLKKLHKSLHPKS